MSTRVTASVRKGSNPRTSDGPFLISPKRHVPFPYIVCDRVVSLIQSPSHPSILLLSIHPSIPHPIYSTVHKHSSSHYLRPRISIHLSVILCPLSPQPEANNLTAYCNLFTIFKNHTWNHPFKRYYSLIKKEDFLGYYLGISQFQQIIWAFFKNLQFIIEAPSHALSEQYASHVNVSNLILPK